jgi:hypothetical protein
LKCFDYHELEGATVGDVLATQKENLYNEHKTKLTV